MMMQRTMNAGSCSMYFLISNFYLLRLQLLMAFSDNTSYVRSENIVLNCGSNSSELVQYDGRYWIGDMGSPYLPFNAHINSLIAKAPATLESIPQVPYMTARIFHSQFSYRFNVTPGPKFIRLHFYPASYLGLNVARAYLSATAGNFTLLHNFSASLTADYFNIPYLMKEFIVQVNESTLELTLTPSSNASDAYAFVNGIEVVSMPLNLYIGGDNAPLPLVGHPQVAYIQNDSAMETLYRLNVGGDQIPPKYDTGMFRTWDSDDDYIFGAGIGVEPFNMTMPILYAQNVPAYAAPVGVYRTSRAMPPFENNSLINLNYNLTWFFPIDSGFNYLVRLHFCDVFQEVTKVNEVVFSIFLNNQTADSQFDLIDASGGRGVAVYEDYVVMVLEASEGRQDLWLDLHPYTESKPLYYTALLNGVEIFKLSSADKNLAGLNPFKNKSESAVKVPHFAPSKNPKKFTFIFIGCAPVAVALPILLCLVLYRLKVIEPGKIMSWCGLPVLTPNETEKANKSSFCRHFSLSEIKVATHDFDEALLIGTGGFGRVYKGSLDGATSVAIKRGNPMSEQGVSEFETEIRFLSELRHHNLVSLLGYCHEDNEMILVYDYIANGTLFDHLHLRQRDQNQPALSWIQRLEICIGVARGLHYLHTGTQHRIIHRDIKTTNILLDQNWVAKISDFGLSKASYPALSTTNVKGSIGYLDPEYFQCHKLTDKSDLYSFGVVLLEVLSARPAVSVGEDDNDHVNLAEWAMFCFDKGNIEQIVDPKLEGSIAAECFEIFVGVAIKCLAERGVERPSAGEVLQKLVVAMQYQKNAGNGISRDGNVHRDDDDNGWQSNSDLTPGVEFSDIMMPSGR